MSQNPSDLTQHAMSLLASNRLAEARLVFIEICRLTPGDSQTWVSAATISGELGLKEEAKAHLNTAIELDPNNEQAYLALALLLSGDGDHMNALDMCKRALSIDNDYPEAWLVHSGILGKIGHYDDAAISAKRAIDLAPDMADAHINLGNSLDAAGRYDAACSAFRQAISLEPDAAKAHIALARSLASQGHFEDAKAACARAEQLAPHDPGLTCMQARIHEQEGRYQEAFDLLQPLVGSEAFDAGAAITLANAAKRLDHAGEIVVILEAMLKQDEILQLHRRHIHMTLGHLYDKMESYNKAFHNFEKGNSLATETFDPDAYEAAIDRYINNFSNTHLDALSRAQNESELPVFIVGMPRSGTTLTEQILSSHPNTTGAGELHDIYDIAATLATKYPSPGYPECLHIASSEILTELADNYLLRLRNISANALRIVDKMPGNFLHLGLIQQLFPSARIIHCVRDPIDTCLSCYFQTFHQHGYTHNLSHLGRYYLQYRRLMTHWHSILQLPILEVRYENLVADTEAMSRKIIGFCGLPWDDQCLRFYENKRTVITASYQQVRRPIYHSSVQRWRNYENHLQPLLAELQKHPNMLDS